MIIFEFLSEHPIVWILVLIAVVLSVVILFTKYLIIDNWDKIFKKKVDNNEKNNNDDLTVSDNQTENQTEDKID